MIQVCAFYYFKPLATTDITQLKHELEEMAQTQSVRGLVLIGPEGINFTISGPSRGIEAFKSWLTARMNLSNPKFKDSFAEKHPFHIFKVKIKKEIVTLGHPEHVPGPGTNHHISPSEWRKKMHEGAVVLDTRNDYEVEIGKFKGAKDFRIKEFHDFPERLKTSGLPKDRDILIYCTGGIRCEKAILEMQGQGYERVYQLDGGILNFLKEFPNDEFEGECFVFDYRVAVDQHLNPTQKYKLCTHCGQPAEGELKCSLCESPGIVCNHCIALGITTCSKNCAHHARIGSHSHRPHLQEKQKRHRT